MSCDIENRRIPSRPSISVRSLLVLASILVSCLGTRTVGAESLVASSNASMHDVLREMDELKQELGYLRQRDAERQAWQDSVIQRLPTLDNVSLGGGDWADSTCESTADPSCDGCSCKCCGKFGSCLCPLDEAPCLPCPRVSTLRPHYNVHIFGAMVGDMLFNEPRPLSPGTPFFLLPGSPFGLEEQTVDIHARSSFLAAAFTGPQMGNLQAGGLASALFYNDNVLADRYGVLPLQLWGDLKNEYWRFAAGLQFDVFNPGIPTMLVFSALGASGNAGNAWRGQVRVERYFHPADDVQWTVQAALSEPISTVVDPVFGLNEDNGWPNIEGRVALGLGMKEGAGVAAKRPFEVGVSGLVGEIRTTPPSGARVEADVWGVGADARWKVNDFFGFTAEFYTGETLGTYNAGVLQMVNLTTLEGIRTTGGYGEVFFYWTPCLHSHIGYGIDDPLDRDVSFNPLDLPRVRNETIFANLLWDVNQAFRIGFEFTWRETAYHTLPDNEGPGLHTQFRWRF